MSQDPGAISAAAESSAAAAPAELSIDYSSSAGLAPRDIIGVGYTGVWRYVSPEPAKNLTPGERDALHAVGLGIALLWEDAATNALGGAAAGMHDGTRAVGQARALGLPVGCPLLANLGDFAATPAQITAIQAYYHEFRRVAGFAFQFGGYATAYIIDQ